MEHEVDGNVGVVSFPQGVAGEVRWKSEPSWLPPTCLRSTLQGKVDRGVYEVDGNVGVGFPQGVAKGKKKTTKAVLTKPTRETARQSSCQKAVVGRMPRHQGASTRLGGKHGGVGVDEIVQVDVCVTKVDGFAGGWT